MLVTQTEFNLIITSVRNTKRRNYVAMSNDNINVSRSAISLMSTVQVTTEIGKVCGDVSRKLKFRYYDKMFVKSYADHQNRKL
jgi:hypothetical protein